MGWSRFFDTKPGKIKVGISFLNSSSLAGLHSNLNRYLAALLLSLNLLAFLFHTILDLVDEQYRAIRLTLGTRRRFFQDLEALLRYFQFENWDEVLAFMFNGLELDTG